MSDTKCIWNMGTPCSDNVKDEKLFNDQIIIPICEHHFDLHKKLLFLHSCGLDAIKLVSNINEIENLFKEYRDRYPEKEIKT